MNREELEVNKSPFMGKSGTSYDQSNRQRPRNKGFMVI